MLMVHWIIPTSSNLLSVLSAHGLNFSGIVYGADIQGGPSDGYFYWRVMHRFSDVILVLTEYIIIFFDQLI